MKGLLLISHGSQRREANEDFLRLAGEVQRRLGPSALVQASFLELAEPSVSAAIDRLVQSGATEITVLPYFLSHGSHTMKDIPDLLSKKTKAHPAIPFTILSPIGALPEMTDLILKLIHPQPAQPAAGAGQAVHRIKENGGQGKIS